MEFKHIKTITLDLDYRLQWLFYSSQQQAFITGDRKQSYSICFSQQGIISKIMGKTLVTSKLKPQLPFDPEVFYHHPCDLPIPLEIYNDFIKTPWRGFHFLASKDYDNAVDKENHPVGSIVLTLLYSPDNGLYVLHPANNFIISLRSGSIKLLRQEKNSFSLIDETRTRGKSALAFAAHNHDPIIAYGDNYGGFYCQIFDETGFGKIKKITTKERKASQLQFIDDGEGLLIAGMGYLLGYSYIDGKFTQLHEISIAVRDFIWFQKHRFLIVNQGMHGFTIYRYDINGFTKIGDLKLEKPIESIAVSQDLKYFAICLYDTPGIFIYSNSDDRK